MWLAIESWFGLLIVRRRDEPIATLVLSRWRVTELGVNTVLRLAKVLIPLWRGRLAILGRRRARQLFLVIVTTRNF